jgi:hypothetical protein
MKKEIKLWVVCVYVPHGYFSYPVSRKEQAIEHAQEIMTRGVYRRSIPGAVEMYPVVKVKVVGEGLESAYADSFQRT